MWHQRIRDREVQSGGDGRHIGRSGVCLGATTERNCSSRPLLHEPLDGAAEAITRNPNNDQADAQTRPTSREWPRTAGSS
jgi:hypothetical protein